ncbi:MAG: class I SAM-dependent methyltransferase [archaeon]|nr:class I SAM-dependent methyltransferase [archaeon]
MEPQKEAWERLYREQSRPWRGVADVSFMDVRPGEKVLDAGCGNGKTSAALIEAGAEVTGTDYSASAVESCVKLLGDRAEFLVADSRDLPFGDGSFDAVVSVHMLEHVPAEDSRRAASELMRVLVPGGRLYLRCFAEGDMRSDGKKEDVRNGILYRYFSEDDIRDLFGQWDVVSIVHRDEPTRFGTVRRRLECVVGKPL